MYCVSICLEVFLGFKSSIIFDLSFLLFPFLKENVFLGFFDFVKASVYIVFRTSLLFKLTPSVAVSLKSYNDIIIFKIIIYIRVKII
jgi:hypothetical protein